MPLETSRTIWNRLRPMSILQSRLHGDVLFSMLNIVHHAQHRCLKAGFSPNTCTQHTSNFTTVGSCNPCPSTKKGRASRLTARDACNEDVAPYTIASVDSCQSALTDTQDGDGRLCGESEGLDLAYGRLYYSTRQVVANFPFHKLQSIVPVVRLQHHTELGLPGFGGLRIR